MPPADGVWKPCQGMQGDTKAAGTVANPEKGSVTTEVLAIDDSYDKKFKPGLYRMVDSFVNGNGEGLCTVKEQAGMFGYYCQMANYV